MDFMSKNFGRLTFGRALKANRMAAKIKQEDLAKAANVSKQAVSRFENGKDFPTAETAGLLAKALGMDVAMYEVLIVRDMAEKRGFHGVEVSLKKAG